MTPGKDPPPELAETQLAPAVPSAEARVPDLDLPAPRPADAVAPKPTATPDDPNEGGAGDFEMELERDSALATLASMQSPGFGAHAPQASRLEVTHRRATATAPQRASDDDVSLARTIVAHVAAGLLSAAALLTLAKLAHRPGGRALTSALPYAFDGTSVTASGVVSGLCLVTAIALGFLGLRLRPRSWATVASGGAMLLTSLAMVTVTLVATEENPSPPDGALLVPYVVPLALVTLAIGIAGRAAQLFIADGLGPKAAAILACAVAGALAFAAAETSVIASMF